MHRFGMKSQLISRRNMRRMKQDSGFAGAPPGFVPTGQTPTPTAAPDNTGGNQAPAGGESGAPNNTGQEFDAEAFWNPAPAGGPAGSGATQGSAPAATPPEPENPHAALGQELQSDLTGMNHGSTFMTADMAEKMSQGDFSGFNTGLQKYGQDIARSTMQMSVKVMRAMRDQIMADAGKQTQQEFGTREQTAALHAAIPSAKNPAIAKVVAPIWEQALKLFPGNNAKAIEATKAMLKATNQQLVGDDSLGIAPAGPADSAPKVNWLDELAGR